MISVCMATYNGERFIKQQIDSILPQLSKDDELIISDDGSTDSTLDIIATYNDERIKILNHQKNPNFAKIKYSRNFYYATENFENALKIANGDYIFLSDQDDIWKENRIKRILAELCSSDCVMCNYDVIDSNNRIIYEKFLKKNPISPRLIQNIVASRFTGCCMSFNRAVLQYILPFPKKLLAHDFWIGCLANKKFKFSFIDEPLHLYRRTGNNVSPSVTGSENNLLYKFTYRLVFLLQIFKRLLLK